jgi:NTP pyrophosphatase (non-canonical NTP hydrolase)
VSKIKTLNDYAAECHRASTRWWYTAAGKRIVRNEGELLCLIHSEITELFSAELTGFKDDKLPHLDATEVELADVLIRLFDYAGAFNFDLNAALKIVWPGHRNKCELFRINYGIKALEKVDKFRTLLNMHKAVTDIMEAERRSANATEVSVLIVTLITLIADYAVTFEYDIDRAYTDKLAYNATRHDHTLEARAEKGGKKW